MSGRVPAAHYWPSNAALIADVAELHLHRGMAAVDTTYGEGNWWKTWRPDTLVTHDLYKGDGVDFRQLPEDDHTYDLAAFDPPYVAMGGRTTSKIPKMMDAFGLKDAPRTPAELQAVINDGLAEVFRVLRRKGMALVKCKSYVSSGQLWMGEYLTLDAARDAGFEVVDYFTHLNSGRPQPGGRPQEHAERRPSVLYVFRKPAKAAKRAA